VKNGLLFERFLSEMRVDGKARGARHRRVDFEHDRRRGGLDYMYERYTAPARRPSPASCRLPRAERGAGRDARVRILRRAGHVDFARGCTGTTRSTPAVKMQERYAEQAGLDLTRRA